MQENLLFFVILVHLTLNGNYLLIYLLIYLLLCKPHVEYKITDNDWNHIRPVSLDLN